jgi:hypothetical protein
MSGAAVAGCQHGTPPGPEATPVSDRPIEEVLRDRTDHLMGVPGVVGIAQGLCDGRPCIKVFVAKKTPALLEAIPDSVEGYPVDVEETGEFRPFGR